VYINGLAWQDSYIEVLFHAGSTVQQARALAELLGQIRTEDETKLAEELLGQIRPTPKSN